MEFSGTQIETTGLKNGSILYDFQFWRAIIFVLQLHYYFSISIINHILFSGGGKHLYKPIIFTIKKKIIPVPIISVSRDLYDAPGQ